MTEFHGFLNNKLFWINRLLSDRGYPEALEVLHVYRADVNHVDWGGLMIWYITKNNSIPIQLTIPFEFDNNLITFIWKYIAECGNNEMNNK